MHTELAALTSFCFTENVGDLCTSRGSVEAPAAGERADAFQLFCLLAVLARGAEGDKLAVLLDVLDVELRCRAGLALRANPSDRDPEMTLGSMTALITG